jgi:dihydrodipicolinate synthase/N-acetylneuraminate lyase
MMIEVDNLRKELQATIFPGGIPRLWCPTLTHFQAAQQPDGDRIRSHLRSLAARVRGILVPGSTGEGWEMNDRDIRGLLNIVLDAAQESNIQVLIGVLKTNVDEMLSCIRAMDDFLDHPAVVGITVCPPKGADLSQQAIEAGLAAILELGVPTALYQLPQVTQNEMNAETVCTLANRYPNFILFKDTSGADRVAYSGQDLGSVFLVRGAEQGGYAAWPKVGGGRYDGFLLSTANVFSKELDQILQLLNEGDRIAAQSLSEKLVNVVTQAFSLVRELPVGNAFANANKMLDHCMAHGEEAARCDPPILYSGNRLSSNLIESAMQLLQQHSLMPKRGYLSAS